MPCGGFLPRPDADLVLSGHDHDYERFAPMNAQGEADPKGLTEFVVGTGGASHYRFHNPEAASAVRITGRNGVLRLQLTQQAYAWQFMAAPDGEVLDSGKHPVPLGPIRSSLLQEYTERIASRYVPYPDADRHCWLGSTAVPSPHSLKLVISCHRAPEATWRRRSASNRAGVTREARHQFVELEEAGRDRCRVGVPADRIP